MGLKSHEKLRNNPDTKAENIVDFIYEKGHFRRGDVIAKFGITRKEYDNLAHGFEEIGLLIKDKNQKNLRVLNTTPPPVKFTSKRINQHESMTATNSKTNSQPTTLHL